MNQILNLNSKPRIELKKNVKTYVLPSSYAFSRSLEFKNEWGRSPGFSWLTAFPWYHSG